MQKTRKSPYMVDSVEQLECLSSPVRQEILDAIAAAGPSSATEIAELLNRAPDSLYYHLKLLEDVNLVSASSRQLSEAKSESVFDVPGRPMTIGYASAPKIRAAIGRVVSGVLRLTDRDFQAAVQREDLSQSGNDAPLIGGRIKSWLNEKQVMDVKAHLREIDKIFAGGVKSSESQPFAFSRVFLPLENSRRVRTPLRSAAPQKEEK